VPAHDELARVFDEIFERVSARTLFPRLRAQAYGDEDVPELQAFSALSRTELARFPAALRLAPDATFADLACGLGGPGLWVARATGAALIGVDFSTRACALAAARVPAWGVRAEFRVGRLDAIGLDDASLDAAMSVDAVQIAPRRAAVFAEAARVLKPGARLAFTTWDLRPGARAIPGRERVEDNRPLLEAAGFAVLAYDEAVGWRERARRECELWLAHESALRAELGELLGGALVEEARFSLDGYIEGTRRVFVVAERV
jgi:SAM-dependent methyltransferase